MYSTFGWGKQSQEGKFEKIQFQRQEGGARDVTFRLKYCGVCHTREIGADYFLVSTEGEKMKEAEGSLDLIINTISANHDLTTYLSLLVR